MINRQPRPIDVYHDECMARAEAEAAQRSAADPAEEHRVALSEALGLGTGASWEAIRERAAELAAVSPSVVVSADRATLLRAADFFRGLHATGTTITAREAEAELRRMAADAVLAVLPEQTDRATPDRGRKAEALLLRFAAEAHRRKWSYDRGLDDDGVPIKSEAFDALHRLGEDMRVELEKLRRLAAEQPTETRPSCPDPIECGHEAALGLAEERLDRVRAVGEAWTRPSMSSPTRLAGEHILRVLDAEWPAVGERPDTAEHVCKPGAARYFCPTSGKTESTCHSGFDVCCDRPDLHQLAGVEQPDTQTREA